MARYLGPTCKLSRREGTDLFLKSGVRPLESKCRHESAPGQHGQRRKKPTDFGIQLMAKQKLKGYYGNIGEKQFKKYYIEASRRRGDTGQNLVGLLESRLDAFLYRSKLAPTVFAARQIVNHGHVLLNGKRCNIGSVIVNAGDVIQLREKAKQMPSIIEGIGSVERDVPEYIEADHDKMSATFLRIPTFDEVPYPVQMQPNLVIEYSPR